MPRSELSYKLWKGFLFYPGETHTSINKINFCSTRGIEISSQQQQLELRRTSFHFLVKMWASISEKKDEMNFCSFYSSRKRKETSPLNLRDLFYLKTIQNEKKGKSLTGVAPFEASNEYTSCLLVNEEEQLHRKDSLLNLSSVLAYLVHRTRLLLLTLIFIAIILARGELLSTLHT